MSAVNPYSPPRAAVEDRLDGETFQEVRVWSAAGRIGRLRYLAYSVAGYLLFSLATVSIGAFAKGTQAPGVIIPLMLVFGLAYLVLVVLSGIQRAHDMDWSGWAVLLAFIPLVGLIWVFKGGTMGSNRFGPPPVPNSRGVKIGALLLPAIAIIGILAAIALPAYQQYAARAKATQAP